MKYLFLLGIFIFFKPAELWSQSITLNKANAPLEKVLKAIRKQSGYDFIGEPVSVRAANPVTIKVRNATLFQALEICFTNQNLTYTIKDKTVVIQLKKQAAIPEKILPVRSSAAVLEKEAMPFELDEVDIISTGYQHIKSEQLTGAVSTIGSKAYESRINANNFLRGLENRLPGLMINDQLTFEGNNLFNIRGISTISANKQPLIILDNYPTELSLDYINPNDIESITVLKDAAAASIYGVRSSNGVIVVERKKSHNGPVKFSFLSTFGFSPKENYSTYRFAPANTKMNFVIDYYDRSPLYPQNYYTRNPTARYDTGSEPLIKLASGLITRQQMEEQMAQGYAYNNAGAYSDLFEQNKASHQYDLGISGGNDKMNWYISSNFTGNRAAKIKSSSRQFLLSARGSYNFNNRLSLNLNADVISSRSEAVPVRDIDDYYVFERFQDSHGNPLATLSGSPVNPLYNLGMQKNGFEDNMYYPLKETREVQKMGKVNAGKISGELSYKLLPGLSAKIGGIYENNHTENENSFSENASLTHQYVNMYTLKGPDGSLIRSFPKTNFMLTDFDNITNYTVRGQLNYDKLFSTAHQLNLIGGTEVRQVTLERSGAVDFGDQTASILQQPIFTTAWRNTFYPGNPKLDLIRHLQHSAIEDRYISAYFNGIYTFRSRYMLSSSLRIDQSNLYGGTSKYRYKPLWSFGLAWNIGSESFMKDLTWVNRLKLRISEGFNGNISKASLPRVITTYASNPLTSPLTTGLNISSPGNKSLRWEETNSFNVGLDFSLFSIFSVSLDYYDKRSRDLLGNTATDPTKGVSVALLNSGSVNNHGLELNLNTQWRSNNEFSINSGICVSYNRSRVTNFSQQLNSSSMAYFLLNGPTKNYVSNYPVGALFSYRFAGLNAEGLPTVYGNNGQIKNIENGFDEKLTDLTYSGSSIPTYTIGVSNQLNIGRFYIYTMIDLYGGFKLRIPRPDLFSPRPLEGAERYFKTSGDELTTDVMGVAAYPAGEYDHIYLAYQNSDRYIVNATYIFLREVTLAYRIKDNFVKDLGLSRMVIKAQCENIYTKGFNRFGYSAGRGAYERRNLVPEFSIGVYTNF